MNIVTAPHKAGDDAELGWYMLSWEGEAQWFAKKDGHVLGGRLRSLDALVGTIRNAEHIGWNLYLNANPTVPCPHKRKLSRENVNWWRYVIVDLDPTPDALAPPSPGSCDHKLLTKAHRIYSGRGYQYWLPLAKMEPRWWDNGLREGSPPAERIMQGYLHSLAAQTDAWAPGWMVDTTCSDLGRVVRCPGSINQKTGKRAVVEQVAPLGGVEVRELLKYAVPPHAPDPAVRIKSENLYAILPHLNVRARTFILWGAQSPGRHSACFATCKNLQEVGVPKETAYRLLHVGAEKCWEADWVQPLSDRDVNKIVKQVYGGHNDGCTTTA